MSEGKKFDRGKTVSGYVLVGFSHRDKHGNRYWKMDCSFCGKRYVLVVYRVASQKKRPGCKKCVAMKKVKHGEASEQTPTYISWCRMLQRVRNTGNPKDRHIYKNITCDKRWFDYREFKKDMGERPKGKTLDRIDGLKGYYKENCRWATPKEQRNNQIKR